MTLARTALTMAFVLVATVGAHAQVPNARDGSAAEQDLPDPHARAQVLLGEGLQDVAAERWQEALDHFLEAQQLFPSPLLVFNIGYCERALGRSVDAIAQFQEFTSAELVGLAATRRAEAEGYLRELEARIAHLTIRLDESAQNAVLSVDGQVTTAEAVNRALDPGYHSVQGLLPGHRTFFVERRLRPGEHWDVLVHMVPVPGHLRVTADILPAEVELDGETRGSAPAEFDLDPGTYRLAVTSPGRTPHVSELHIAAGATVRVHAHLPIAPTPLRKRWWFWSAIGAGLLAVGATAFLLGRPEPSPPPYDGGNLGWVAGQTP